MIASYRFYINFENVASEKAGEALEEKLLDLVNSGKLDEVLAANGFENASFHLEPGVEFFD
jgi:hypothetical protein